MKKSKNICNISKKERFFCHYYLNTGNIKEAAILAGFKKNPEEKAIQILSKQYIKSEIDSIFEDKKKNLIYKACIGYERLAFGNIDDCIKIILNLNNFNKNFSLENLNLFNISEIKFIKDGNIEIKFADRLKALEKLENINLAENNNNTNNIYSVLEKSTENLNNIK